MINEAMLYNWLLLNVNVIWSDRGAGIKSAKIAAYAKIENRRLKGDRLIL